MFSLFCLAIFCKSKKVNAVVVDCGSSGSRPYIYEYNDKDNWPNIKYIDHKKLDIRLADAATDAKTIQKLVDEIYNFAKKKIDKDDRKDTKIYVYATAGMRLLPIDTQEKILSDLVKELEKQTKFIVKKKNIKVITGDDEGRFLWLALNQIISKFEDDSTVGALDYGGASAQIGIQLDENKGVNNPDYIHLNIKGKEYSLFTHSFLGLGMNEANKAIKDTLINESIGSSSVENPCFFKGYEEDYSGVKIVGKPSFDACSNLIQKVLIPRVKEITIPQYSKKINKFYAVGNYVDFAEFAQMKEDNTLSDILTASKEVCKLTYDEALLRSTDDTPVFCFSGVLAYNKLANGYEED